MSEPVILDEAVDRILTSPAPILIPDTCALLDLIRIPYRSESAQDASQTAVSALELANELSHQNPSKLWVVIFQMVLDEWIRHFQSTFDELRRHLRCLDEKNQIVNATALALDIELPAIVCYQDVNIEDALKAISTEFLQNKLLLSPDASCERRAYLRTIRNEAPSRKGGQVKDCTIVEHALELCNRLRSRDFDAKCIFMTSNKNDFCQKNSSVLKPPLDVQFDSVGLVLTTRWNWTKAEYETEYEK